MIPISAEDTLADNKTPFQHILTVSWQKKPTFIANKTRFISFNMVNKMNNSHIPSYSVTFNKNSSTFANKTQLINSTMVSKTVTNTLGIVG